MSVKMKVSYETDKEFSNVKKILAGRITKTAVEPPKGKYKRAYIFLKDVETWEDTSDESKPI